MSQKNHIVVARYNEDLSWLKDISREDTQIFIYNKGQKIEIDFGPGVSVIEMQNVGREAQTYFYHILKNYGDLPEKIIFTQAHPDDHVSSNFQSEVSNFLKSNSEFKYFSKNVLEMKITEDGVEESGDLNGFFWRNKHSLNSCCVAIPVNLIPDLESRDWIFGTGAIFGVSKNKIEQNSKEFYQRCLDFLEKSSDPLNSPEAHAFERSWYLIFNQ